MEIVDLLAFVRAEWKLISENYWTFIIFGVFLFVIGFVISWGLNTYFVQIKIHNIPERESLLNDLDQRDKEIKELKEKLNKKTLADEVQEFKKSSETSIGAVISKNKKAD